MLYCNQIGGRGLAGRYTGNLIYGIDRTRYGGPERFLKSPQTYMSMLIPHGLINCYLSICAMRVLCAYHSYGDWGGRQHMLFIIRSFCLNKRFITGNGVDYINYIVIRAFN